MPAGTPDMPTEQAVREALTEVLDPELGVNIVDLGLVYAIDIDRDAVAVTMTTTTPACPLNDYLTSEAERMVRERIAGVGAVSVQLVWEPPWSPDLMSAHARALLGG